MAMPIISIPQAGRIATRPRRESIYDTEGYQDATAIPVRLEIYKNSQTFSNANLGIGTAKVKGRDHNLDGRGGALPKGTMFHWYGWCMKHFPMNGNTFGAASLVIWDEIRRIREVTWTSFQFGGSNTYIQVPTWQIPEGAAAICGRFTTNNATTMIGEGTSASRQDNYDVTLNGVPTEIGELESFSVLVEAGPSTPSPTQDVFVCSVLKGISFKGIQG